VREPLGLTIFFVRETLRRFSANTAIKRSEALKPTTTPQSALSFFPAVASTFSIIEGFMIHREVNDGKLL
jgi:hypothetical protein